jgi:hypothetical protein
MKIEPSDLLSDCPKTPLNAPQPSPLGVRLDGLVALANGEGIKTSRVELVSALILSAPPIGNDLFERVLKYRKAVAADAALPGDSSENVLELRKYPRGPRKRAG